MGRGCRDGAQGRRFPRVSFAFRAVLGSSFIKCADVTPGDTLALLDSGLDWRISLGFSNLKDPGLTKPTKAALPRGEGSPSWLQPVLGVAEP